MCCNVHTIKLICIMLLELHVFYNLGCLLTVTGTVTHTTEKTIEAEVVVNVTYPFKPRLYSQPVKAAEAYFTYVAFDKKKNVTPVPQLKVSCGFILHCL